jgi:hypothetical protein
VFFSAAASFADTSLGQPVSGGELTHATANRFRAEAKGVAHSALPSMSKGLRFQGGIMAFLPFIQCLEKLLFDVKVFDDHAVTLIELSKKLKLFF